MLKGKSDYFDGGGPRGGGGGGPLQQHLQLLLPLWVLALGPLLAPPPPVPPAGGMGGGGGGAKSDPQNNLCGPCTGALALVFAGHASAEFIFRRYTIIGARLAQLGQ